MINSTYSPTKISDFESSKLSFNALGSSFTVAPGTTSNIDLTLTDDMLITGAWLISVGAYGDTVTFQVLDPDQNILSQFVTNWAIPAPANMTLDVPYPAKLPAGIILRLIYSSTGSTPAFVAINYKLHKILV